MLEKRFFIKKICTWGFFLILALPVLSIPPWFSPSAWGKTIIFRIIISTILLAILGKWLFKKDLSLQNISKTGRIFLLLLLGAWTASLLATVFSLDPHFSFWGSPQRSWGFLNLSCYFLFTLLLFLKTKQKTWLKLWSFSIFISTLISLIAIMQKLKIGKGLLIANTDRPYGTLGNPIFLALYLLIPIFILLANALKEKKRKKKLLLFSIIAFFLFVIIFLTLTRAALIGLFLGALYFVFFYPRKLPKLKIAVIFLCILSAVSLLYINSKKEVPVWVQEINLLHRLWQRLDIKGTIEGSRIIGWQAGLRAFADRPILGYGLYNFSIGYNKYYGLFGKSADDFYSTARWWDTAHSLYIDILVSSGIIGLVSYLLLFGFLFWKLNKTRKKNPELAYECHGAQASLIAYLSANFFSFDTFSTYILFFFLIAYSASLINQSKKNEKTFNLFNKLQDIFFPFRYGILAISLIFFFWISYVYNIKPMIVNKEINWALHYSENEECVKALNTIEKISPNKTVISHYLGLKYIDIISSCISKLPENRIPLAEKAVSLLKENIKQRPKYTRNWLFLGEYTNILLANTKDAKEIQELKIQAETSFKKAQELNPHHYNIFLEWAQTCIFIKKYEESAEKAKKCLELNPRIAACWWYQGIAQIYTGEMEEARENILIAKQKGYPINSEKSLLELADAHSKDENYAELEKIYILLTKHSPENFQYHASLSYVYKMRGKIEKAKAQALRVLEISPELEKDINEFIKSLEIE